MTKRTRISNYTLGDKKGFIDHAMFTLGRPQAEVYLEERYCYFPKEDVATFINHVVSTACNMRDERAKEVFLRRLVMGYEGPKESYACIAKTLPRVNSGKRKGKQLTAQAVRSIHTIASAVIFDGLIKARGKPFVKGLRNLIDFQTMEEMLNDLNEV